MSRLDTCPAELLSDIFEYLVYLDLQVLVLCGSRVVLNAVRAVRSVNHLDAGVLPLKLPSLAPFRQLSHLTCAFSHGYGTTMASNSFQLNKLPISLRSLRLNFTNAPSLLADNTPGLAAHQYLQLHLLFPNLEVLSVCGEWESISNALFVNLPRRLRSLSLTHSGKCASLEDAHLMFLPPDLVELNLLALKLVTNKPIPLPRDLRVLAALCNPQSLDILVAHLPSGLEQLKLRLPLRNLNQNLFSSLPSSLTSFDVDRPEEPFKVVKTLPKNLTSLVFHSFDIFGPSLEPETVILLPPALRTLEGFLVRPEAISMLPIHLRYISHPLQVPLNELETLPRQLEILSLSSPINATNPITPPDFMPSLLKMMPSKLTRLRITTSIVLSAIDVQSLPATLSSLILDHQVFKDDESVASLPKNLKSLGWALDDLKELSSASIDLLPRSISSLTLSRVSHQVQDHWIPDMTTWNALQTLELFANIPKLTSVIIPRLPRHLTNLRLALSEVIHQDHLIDLAPTLYKLKITSTSFCGLTNNLVPRLPQRLTIIFLPECPYLTSWAVSDLPPGLDRFYIQGSLVSWFPQNFQ